MKKSRRQLGKDAIKAIAAGSTAGLAAKMETGENTSIGEFMNKYTARYVMNPGSYLNPQATEDIEIEPFMRRFGHQTDEMNGLYDVVRDVSKTVRNESGDCVDFSAVACSWLVQHTNKKPRVALYAPELGNDTGHINVYAGGTIYDYDGIYTGTNPQQYAKKNGALQLIYTNTV